MISSTFRVCIFVVCILLCLFLLEVLVAIWLLKSDPQKLAQTYSPVAYNLPPHFKSRGM